MEKRIGIVFVITGAVTAALLGSVSCKDGGGTKPPVTPVVIAEVEHGRLEQWGEQDVLYLWGTREEMGYAEGALLCGRITRFFREYILETAVPESGMSYEELLMGVVVTHIFPEGDEAQMRAIGDGMKENCPPEDLIIESEYLEASAGGRREVLFEDMRVGHALPDFLCSSLTVWGDSSASGGTLHARNLDFYMDPFGSFIGGHIIKVYSSADDGGARFMSVSVPGLVGCISCFTEEGAGVTIHNVDGISTSTPYQHVPRILASREALVASMQAADPVAAAEEVIENSPQWMGDNFHFSFPCTTSDCIGGAVFELDGVATHPDGQVTVRMPGEFDGGLGLSDGIVCTNHFMKRTTEGEHYVDYSISESSSARFQTIVDGIKQAVDSGGVGPDDALEMMASVSRKGSTIATAHTVIMDTGTMEFRLYVAPDIDSSATDAEPVVLNLNDLFDRLP